LVPGGIVDHLRSPLSRLHSTPFGIKHYYNIRNRLVVKRRHSRLKGIATLDGVLYAMLMWLVAGGWRNCAATALMLRSIRDGIAGRLGKYQPGPVGSG
jgi:hypothetical protein